MYNVGMGKEKRTQEEIDAQLIHNLANAIHGTPDEYEAAYDAYEAAAPKKDGCFKLFGLASVGIVGAAATAGYLVSHLNS